MDADLPPEGRASQKTSVITLRAAVTPRLDTTKRRPSRVLRSERRRR